MDRVAAIDIGSNSIRAIVADVASDGHIRVVDEMKSAPRLGAGMDERGALAEAAMQRATEAVVRMATLARQLGATRVEAVATSAVRDASNARQFAEMVRRAAKLQLRVLEGSDEALLGFRSALAHFDLASGRAAVVDIGGGSLELALSAAGLVDRLVSLPFGALRMTERYFPKKITRSAVKELRRDVRHELQRHLPAREWRNAQVIGSGGTFTNLAGMSLARQGIRPAQSVHGTRVPRVDLEHILDSLQDMTPTERLTVAGLNAGRSDIIVAGLAVIAEVMARLDSPSLVVSAYGIREGLLLETAKVLPTVASPGEARERSVRRLAEACHFEERHSMHVQRLALQLFDALGQRLGAKPGEREILAAAATLHDIGYHISYDKHHKHSYYLITHAELLGMSPMEQLVVANVARYHRGAPPSKEHPSYGSLAKPVREQVKRLSAILRLADGLDRGHISAVDRVKVRWMRNRIRITPIARNIHQPMRLEVWGASRKAQLLEKIAGVPVEIVGSRVAQSAAALTDRILRSPTSA
ncbi:MAG TPA: Ppx/GppA phosphatase family protein [Gemmatimonadaceae bacterium]|nr:Ppx/GppA phosphatase family protein [Gemmatimonadaceae bacterium]